MNSNESRSPAKNAFARSLNHLPTSDSLHAKPGECMTHKQNKFCSGGPAAPAGAGAAGTTLLALAGDTPKPDIGGGSTGRAKAGKLDGLGPATAPRLRQGGDA